MNRFAVVLAFFILIFPFSAGKLKAQENNPPNLRAVYYFVNNVIRWPDPIVTVTVEESAHLSIMFQYSDADCNLAGGHFYVRQIEPEETDWQDLGVLPDNVKCSSEVDGLIYGFGFNGALEPDYYLGETKWTDAQGAESNVLQWEFEVVEGDDDDLDDDSDDDVDTDSDDDASDDDRDGKSDNGCGC